MEVGATITAGPAVHPNIAPRTSLPYVSASSLTSVCGFINGINGIPMVCPTDAACVVQDTSFFGCCKTAVSFNQSVTSTFSWTATSSLHLSPIATSSSTDTSIWLQGTYSYGSCSLWGPKTCYASLDAGSCVGSCQSSALICNDTNFPYCATYTSDPLYNGGYTTTDPALRSAQPIVTGLFCDTSSYVLPVLEFSIDYTPSTYGPSVTTPTSGAGPTSTYGKSQSSVASSMPPAPPVSISGSRQREAPLPYRTLLMLSIFLTANLYLCTLN